MAINLATKYSKKIAEKFYLDSVIAGKTSRDYDWDGVKSINVHTIVTQDPVDYTRSGTSRYGTPTDVQDTIQTLTITQDKSVSMVVDKGDNKQQNLIKSAGKVVALEQREKFIPMVDKYALSKWNEGRGAYSVKSGAITKNTIVEEIGKHITLAGNNLVTLGDATCFIGYTNFGALVNSPEFLNLEKLGEKALDKGVVGKVRGLAICPVPDSYLPEGVEFLTVKKESVLLPYQIKECKVHEDAPGISGALMEIRYLYDAFVLEAKNAGVIACLASTPTGA